MRRQDGRDVIVLEDEGSSSIGWFILGAAVGAGVALLLAPASGEDTRRRISRGARRIKDTAVDALEELRDDWDDIKDRASETVDQVKATARGVAEDVEEGAKAVAASAARPRGTTAAREELERRLADARARRRQPEDQEPVA
ncbi:MAG TPA: YtxH domain-containing protein [Gemmatimonadales bacterium]